MNDNSRGSEWRLWDLHFHTPASFDYRSKLSYEDLGKAINNSQIECIAVTDHWTVEGFYQLQPHLKKGLLAMPGIELRIDKTAHQKGFNGSGVIQALVIFPEGSTHKQIEENFLFQVNLCEDEGMHVTKEDLIKVGKRMAKPDATDEECYQLGCQQAYVDLKQVVDKAHKMGAIVSLSYDRYGGFDNIDPVNDSIFKSNLVRDCDLIEVSKEEVQKAFYEDSRIIQACGKKTPAFRGSDAHEVSEIGRGGIWIKSEKSYEGLKQIIYFPKERISFSDSKPISSYPRITEIQLANLSGEHPLTTLSQPVSLSENLNAIIGAPSIGKSTFAELTCYVFDKHTTKEPGEKLTKVENIRSINPQLTIVAKMKNGNVESKLQRTILGDYSGSTVTKDDFPITYLNQGYIDRTARNPKAVSDLIEETMENREIGELWDVIEALKEQVKENRDKYLQKFKLLEERETTVSHLSKATRALEVSNSAEFKELVTRRREIIDKEKEILSIEQQLSEHQENISLLVGNISGLSTLIKEAEKLLPSIPTNKYPQLPDSLTNLPNEIESFVKLIVNASEKEKLKLEKEEVDKKITDLLKKEGIQLSNNVFKQHRHNQEILEKRLKELDEKLEKCEQAREEHARLTKELKENLELWNNLVKDKQSDFNTGLDDVKVVLKPENEENWIITALTDEAKIAWDTYTPISQKEQKFIKPPEEDIRNILDKIVVQNNIDRTKIPQFVIQSIENNVLPISENLESIKWLFGEKSEVIREFLKLRLKEFAEKGKHQIYYQGKNISNEGLSFTERCGALLEILLEKGNGPIILDQPEENLGSLYITKRLTNMLLKKKVDRQVIIITHNPNTVVLADADLVISFDNEGGKSDVGLMSGAIEGDGIKEKICEIMEGGELAFDLRARRYKSK